MKVLHLLATGGIGGIEILCKDIIKKADWDNRICFLFGEGDIYKTLKKDNPNTFSLVNENKNVKKIVNILKEYCINEKIDIVTVHHRGIKCDKVYSMLHKKMPNIKYVRYIHSSFEKTKHENIIDYFKKGIAKRELQKAFNNSDGIIFISNAVKKSFEENFKIGKKAYKKVIYNGIGEKFYKSTPEYKIDKKQNKTNIAFVGRLTKVKGLNVLIEACNKLKKAGIDFNLNIIGERTRKRKSEKTNTEN